MADKLQHTLTKCGANPTFVNSAVGAIGWSTLFSVFLQLLPLVENDIPKVFAIINDIIGSLKTGGFSLATLGDLYAKDKDKVLAIVQEIAAALGVPQPTPGPVVP